MAHTRMKIESAMGWSNKSSIAVRGLDLCEDVLSIVGHLAEELRNPIAREVLERTEQESSAHLR